MKLGKNITIFLTLSLFLSSYSFAKRKKFIIEPYAGTEFGSWEETQVMTVSSTTTTYNLKGSSLGYLVGSKFLYIWKKKFLIGGDYQYAGITKKYSDSKDSTIDDDFQDVSASKSAGGLVVGFFRKKWSVKFSYFPYNNLVLEKGVVTGDDEVTYSGSALIGTFSYTYKKRINFNLEYVSNTYNKIETGSSSISLPGTASGITYRDLSNIDYRLYLSYPF